MPRPRRYDKPGRLHHVLSRGQDRQKIFHVSQDYRFFLALLGCAVIQGRIRLHAFCLMPNHFHLLVESVDGNLSATMQWILGRYGGYFNATHKHEGHVFSGRFRSFAVLSTVYLLTLIRYIDRNPVKTEKPEDPLSMPWCSAFHHARPGPHPRWLAQDRIERLLAHGSMPGEDRSATYRRMFRSGIPDPVGDEIVEARIEGRYWVEDELDSLIHLGPAALSHWLRRRAEPDSSHTLQLTMVDAGSVLRAVEEIREEEGTPSMSLCGVKRRDPLDFVQAGLLRDLSVCKLQPAAELLGTSAGRVSQRHEIHRRALSSEDPYLGLVARVAHRALALAYGPDVRAVSRESLCP